VQKASNNIIRNIGGSADGDRGIRIVGVSSPADFYVWNNIIYGFDHASNAACIDKDGGGGPLYVYNNTVHDCNRGIRENTGDVYAYNNIVQDCGAGGCFVGTIDGDNNVSEDTTSTGGGNDQTSTEAEFIDEANFDFHISFADIAAKNNGVDMSTDSDLNFTTDIDGDSRPTDSWDIGADEAAATIFRSVAPGATGALDDDNSGADLLTIAASTATFSAAVADNVGIGDVILYDSDDDDDLDSDDTIAFIHGRSSSTSYTVKNESGAWPDEAVTDEDDWEVYRAYTSLANAESGTENSTLTTYGFSFSGGNMNLVNRVEQWNIACYANGTTADSTAVTIDGWTTGAENYLRIFTPHTLGEVGVSQRHDGTPGTANYRMNVDDAHAISVQDPYARIDGLEIFDWGGDGYSSDAINLDASYVEVSNCLVHDEATNNDGSGIHGEGTVNGFKIYNNIVFGTNDGIYIDDYSADPSYAYNNTVTGCSNYGFEDGNDGLTLVNNISYNNTDNYGTESFHANSDYNLSGPVQTDAPGGNSENGVTVTFMDSSADDYHLAPNDAGAREEGTDLSADTYIPFWLDIDGEARAYGTGWDIGADENTITNTLIKGGVQIDGGVRIKKD